MIANLEDLVDRAFKTLPDSQEDFINPNLYDSLTAEIATYKESQDPSDRNYLLSAFREFIDNAYTKEITAKVAALPSS